MLSVKKAVRMVSLGLLLYMTTFLVSPAASQAAESGGLGPFTLVLNQCESYNLYYSLASPSDVTLVITVVSLASQAIENIKVDVDGANGPDVELNGDRFLNQSYPAIVRVQASSIAIATEANCDLPDTAHIEISLIEHAP